MRRANVTLRRANDSPVGVVELLDQPAAIGQSDLNVGDGLGGVEGHRGSGLGLVGGLVLLGGRRRCNQFWGGTREGTRRRRRKRRTETDESLL